MEMNWYVIPIAALIPMIIGFIWYNPKVLGTLWMKEAGVTQEQIESGNMPLIFGLSFLLACLLAMSTVSLTIHQASLSQLFAMQEGFNEQQGPAYEMFTNVMDEYGTLHRSFGHGIVHGIFFSIMLLLPLIATNAMFERKSAKYIFVNWGYWAITLSLMCGVICQFL